MYPKLKGNKIRGREVTRKGSWVKGSPDPLDFRHGFGDVNTSLRLKVKDGDDD